MSVNNIIMAAANSAAQTPVMNWTYQSGLSNTAWGTGAAKAIAWGGGKFCVIGDAGRCATSPDGVTWTYRSGLSATTYGTGNGSGIVWDGSKFCAISSIGRFATSPDGVTWTYVGAVSGAINVNQLVWTGSQFVTTMAASRAPSGYVLRISKSPNGVTWSNSTNTSPGAVTSVTYGLAWDGGSKWAMNSSGGVLGSINNLGTIANPTSNSAFGANLCVYGAGVFCHISTVCRPVADPTSYTELSNATSNFYNAFGGSYGRCGVWNGSQFCVAGDAGKVAISPDGVNWTAQSSLATTSWGTTVARAIAWNGTKFCVVGDAGKVAISS